MPKRPSVALQSATTHTNGKGARTPLQLSRQEEVFERRVIKRQTVRQVAAQMGINEHTVQADEKAELARRASEIDERRETEKAVPACRRVGTPVDSIVDNLVDIWLDREFGIFSSLLYSIRKAMGH